MSLIFTVVTANLIETHSMQICAREQTAYYEQIRFIFRSTESLHFQDGIHEICRPQTGDSFPCG